MLQKSETTKRFIFMAGDAQEVMSQAIKPAEAALEKEEVDLAKVSAEGEKALNDAEKSAMAEFEKSESADVQAKEKALADAKNAASELESSADVGIKQQELDEAKSAFEAKKAEYADALEIAKKDALSKLDYLVNETERKIAETGKKTASTMTDTLPPSPATAPTPTNENPEKMEENRQNMIDLKIAYESLKSAMNGNFVLKSFEDLDPTAAGVSINDNEIAQLAVEFVNNGTGYYKGILKETRAQDEKIRGTLNYYMNAPQSIPTEMVHVAQNLLSKYDTAYSKSIAECKDDPTVSELISSGESLNRAFSKQGEVFSSVQYDALSKAKTAVESGQPLDPQLIEKANIEIELEQPKDEIPAEEIPTGTKKETPSGSPAIRPAGREREAFATTEKPAGMDMGIYSQIVDGLTQELKSGKLKQGQAINYVVKNGDQAIKVSGIVGQGIQYEKKASYEVAKNEQGINQLDLKGATAPVEAPAKEETKVAAVVETPKAEPAKATEAQQSPQETTPTAALESTPVAAKEAQKEGAVAANPETTPSAATEAPKEEKVAINPAETAPAPEPAPKEKPVPNEAKLAVKNGVDAGLPTGDINVIEAEINRRLILLPKNAVATLNGKSIQRSGITLTINEGKAKVSTITPEYFDLHKDKLASKFNPDGTRIA
jgi:hypothetical protein